MCGCPDGRSLILSWMSHSCDTSKLIPCYVGDRNLSQQSELSWQCLDRGRGLKIVRFEQHSLCVDACGNESRVRKNYQFGSFGWGCTPKQWVTACRRVTRRLLYCINIRADCIGRNDGHSWLFTVGSAGNRVRPPFSKIKSAIPPPHCSTIPTGVWYSPWWLKPSTSSTGDGIRVPAIRYGNHEWIRSQNLRHCTATKSRFARSR